MFDKIISAFKKRQEEKRAKRIKEYSEILFDIGVHKDTIWFFYDGEPVCPIGMFSVKEPSEVIMIMRELYIKRKSEK